MFSQAIISDKEYVETTKLTKITNVSQLKAGLQFILTYTDGSNVTNAMGENTGKIQSIVPITIANNAAEIESTVQVVTLEKVGEYWALNLGNGKYLNYSGSGNDVYATQKTVTTSDAGYLWTITVDGEEMLIKNVGAADRILQYNPSNPRFSCYAGTQKNPTAYLIG